MGRLSRPQRLGTRALAPDPHPSPPSSQLGRSSLQELREWPPLAARGPKPLWLPPGTERQERHPKDKTREGGSLGPSTRRQRRPGGPVVEHGRLARSNAFAPDLSHRCNRRRKRTSARAMTARPPGIHSHGGLRTSPRNGAEHGDFPRHGTRRNGAPASGGGLLSTTPPCAGRTANPFPRPR